MAMLNWVPVFGIIFHLAVFVLIILAILALIKYLKKIKKGLAAFKNRNIVL